MFQVIHDARSKYRYAYKDASFLGFERHICPTCGRVITSMRYDDPAHRLILEGGSTYPDFLQFCGAGEGLFLLSESAIEVFKKNGITGFSTEAAVTVYDDNRNLLFDAPRYFCVNITGRAELNLSAMKLKKKKYCSQCGQFDWSRQRIDPLILDESTWDGSDICRLHSIPGYVVASQKFNDVVNRNDLIGFAFAQI